MIPELKLSQQGHFRISSAAQLEVHVFEGRSWQRILNSREALGPERHHMSLRPSGLSRTLKQKARTILQDAFVLQAFKTKPSETAAQDPDPPAFRLNRSNGATAAPMPMLKKRTALSAHAEKESKHALHAAETLQRAARDLKPAVNASNQCFQTDPAVQELQVRLQQAGAQLNDASVSHRQAPNAASLLQHGAVSLANGARKQVLSASLQAAPTAAQSQPEEYQSLAGNSKQGLHLHAPMRMEAHTPKSAHRKTHVTCQTTVSSANASQSGVGAQAGASSRQQSQQDGHCSSKRASHEHALKHPIDLKVSEEHPAARFPAEAAQKSRFGGGWKSFLAKHHEQLPWSWDDMREEMDLAFNQLPEATSSGALNWTGATQVASRPFQQGLLGKEAVACRPGCRISLTVNGQEHTMQPIWLNIHQPSGSTTARIFEGLAPMSEASEKQMQQWPSEAFHESEGRMFSEPDVRFGDWSSYFVAVSGELADAEEDVLWPNQIVHRDRTMFNARNGDDIATFLADATKEDIDQHLDNLRRLQEGRQYRPAWCFHMLRLRWGASALDQHGFSLNSVANALTVSPQNVSKDISGQRQTGRGLMAPAYGPMNAWLAPRPRLKAQMLRNS